MEITGITSSRGRPSIERFFMDFFYADYLMDPSDLPATLAEYLELESEADPGGKKLLVQTEELLGRNLSDAQLAELIEQWGPNIYLSRRGLSYRPVLIQIRDYLRGPK
jgi:hypothetical protein